MNKKVRIILMAVLLIVLAGGGVFVGMNWNNWFGQEEAEPAVTEGVDENAEVYTGDKSTYTGEKNTDTIDIPGFDSMTFKADVTDQAVNLYNPEQNSCYFKMSLLLSDRTLLWESGLIEPGRAVYNITLKEALGIGSYEDAILKYECFSMDEGQTPLNGSEIKFVLNVIE